MTFAQIKMVKRLLAVVLVAFGGLVAHQLYQSRKTKVAGEAPPLDANQASSVTRQVVHRTLDGDGRVVFELRAAERSGGLAGAQTFKSVEIHFEAGKEKKPLKITADLCRVDLASKAAHLEGNVVISDDKSLRIETSSLDYAPDPGEVTTDQPLRIFRHGVEGKAGGLRYVTGSAQIELLRDVWFLLTPKAGPPTEIVSKTAQMNRRESVVRFMDDVVVEGGDRRLSCHDLQLYLNEDESGLDHALAYENVEVVVDVPESTSPSPSRREPSARAQGEPKASPGASVGVGPHEKMDAPGRKRLLTKQLEIDFRPDGSMELVRALEGGELILEPPPLAAVPEAAPTTKPEKDLPMKRTVRGNLLAFEMDPDGHLTAFRGRGGVTLLLEPVGAPASETRRVDARQFEATFDPETKDMAEARCYQAVQFSKGELHAEAETGIFRVKEDRLNLTGTPRLWDSRSTLEATTVDIDVASGDVEANGSVRTTQKAGAGASALGFLPGKGGESVYVVANEMAYERMKDVAVYTGSVRVLRGDNQIQAERMVLKQTEGELEATDAVRTSLLQAKQGARPERVSASAGRFLYGAKDGILRYRESVVVTTPDMSVKGQRVYLTPDKADGSLSELLASGKVEVDLAEKKSRVRGDEVKYRAKAGELEVRGSRATIEDDDKLTEGKELIFILSDDRILVDGRAESRTKTIYTSKPRQ